MQYSSPEKSPTLFEMLSLQGKTALVVGGAGLLGSEISHVLAELGANIIVASRDLKKCNAFIENLSQKYPTLRYYATALDIADPESIKAGAHQISDLAEGQLDILVNCGWSGKKNTFESISDEDWNYDVEICLNGVFRTIKAFVPMLKPVRGNILNIASMYGHVAPDYRMYDSERFANPPSYGAAKAAIIQLTKYLASFLSPHQIRVNAISPGPFPFEQTQKENPDFIQRLNAKNPCNRIGKPFELKGAVALLCSGAGSYMTGQNICVDGGWSVW